MHQLVRRLTLPAILFLSLTGAGCRDSGPAADDAPAALPANAATYQLKGIVVSSDATRGQVTIDSEAIPGLMGAMIMPYKLAQPNIASELHPGDHVNARLRVTDTASLLDQIVVTAQAKPDYKPNKFYNVPAPGQAVPNFKFVHQGGKSISIEQFRGKVLLVTFIYTRCPLPDYCIRMSRNFSEVQRLLASDHLAAQTHLLSISFDPAYDTPKVLANYGRMYNGGSFAHWDFAVPSAADLDPVDEFFDVGVTAGNNQTLTHSLSTAVIAPDGKIYRWYPKNDWAPSAVVDDMKQALARRGA
jgi:protein SCO1/2